MSEKESLLPGPSKKPGTSRTADSEWKSLQPERGPGYGSIPTRERVQRMPKFDLNRRHAWIVGIALSLGIVGIGLGLGLGLPKLQANEKIGTTTMTTTSVSTTKLMTAPSSPPSTTTRTSRPPLTTTRTSRPSSTSTTTRLSPTTSTTTTTTLPPSSSTRTSTTSTAAPTTPSRAASSTSTTSTTTIRSTNATSVDASTTTRLPAAGQNTTIANTNNGTASATAVPPVLNAVLRSSGNQNRNSRPRQAGSKKASKSVLQQPPRKLHSFASSKGEEVDVRPFVHGGIR